MKKILSLILCVGLLSLSACSSEKKQMPEQSVDSSSDDEQTRKLETVTQVAENDAPESTVDRKESTPHAA